MATKGTLLKNKEYLKKFKSVVYPLLPLPQKISQFYLTVFMVSLLMIVIFVPGITGKEEDIVKN